MAKRILTDEEKKLWRQVTQQDVPLDKRPRQEAPPPPPPEVSSAAGKKRHFTPPPYTPLPELTRGGYAGIDRNTAERFRKGKAPIDATLDLHGMTRDKAQAALERFLQAHYGRGSRCLLVITGKGVRKDVQQAPERGILRDMLPQWLAGDALRPLVLAYDTAQPKHGGSGAFYILLRRKR